MPSMRMAFLRQPGIDVERPGVGIIRTGAEQALRIDFAAIGAQHRRAPDRITALQHVLQGLRQVGADLEAEAAGLEFDEAVLARFDQLVVETDLAELIDDDGRARKCALAQQMAEDRRLAAAEEAGENRNWDHVCPHQYGTSAVRATRTRFAA